LATALADPPSPHAHRLHAFLASSDHGMPHSLAQSSDVHLPIARVTAALRHLRIAHTFHLALHHSCIGTHGRFQPGHLKSPLPPMKLRLAEASPSEASPSEASPSEASPSEALLADASLSSLAEGGAALEKVFAGSTSLAEGQLALRKRGQSRHAPGLA